MTSIESHRYAAEVVWQRAPGEPFVDQRYSRAHTLRFDGGVEAACCIANSVKTDVRCEPVTA